MQYFCNFFNKSTKKFVHIKYLVYFCTLFRENGNAEYKQVLKIAQMAESVDALVSNTSGAIRAGSTPALGTLLII